jgi:hypothetical protein
MSEIVTGTPAVVGFTNGHDNHGYYMNPGISDKDQMFAANIDGNEQTRDLLEAIAATSVAVEKTGAAGVLATYVASAANSLATEKIGAANILESAKNAAALHLQIALAAAASEAQADRNAAASFALAANNQQAAMMYANSNASAAILFAAQNQAALAKQLAECCCEQKALVLAIDAQNVRDQYAMLQTQFMMVTGGLTPVGLAAATRGRIAA